MSEQIDDGNQADDRRRQRRGKVAGRRTWLRSARAPSVDLSELTDSRVHLQSIINVRQLVSGEWAWDVLIALAEQPTQYGDLLAKIQRTPIDNRWPGRAHRRLRDGSLTRTLRRLEQSELVGHVRETEFPYHTTYHICAPARELIESMLPVAQWGERYKDLVARAQHRRHQEKPET